MAPELQRVLQAFDAEDLGGSWRAKCPICGHRALSIDAGDKTPYIVHCWKCKSEGQQELAKRARDAAQSDIKITINLGTLKPRTKTAWPEEELRRKMEQAEQALAADKDALDFLTKRGISTAVSQQHHLGMRSCYRAKRVVVPYFENEFQTTIYQLRYRALVVPTNWKGDVDKSQKWKCEKRELGYRRLFNLPLLLSWDTAGETPLVLTESELDAMMLESLGVAACSVDSAGHKLTPDDLELLRRVKHLVLAFDTDEEGRECTSRFKEQLPQARILTGYDAKDLGDLRTAIGADAFEQRIRNFLAQVQVKEPKVENVQVQVINEEPEMTKRDLPDEALDGWLGEICRERLSEFPRAAAWTALVTAASVHVPGANRCNLNGVLVGRAGDGKSEIAKRAMWLMSADIAPFYQTVAIGSGEGLVRTFKDANKARRLLYQDELADLMGKTRIEGSSLGQKLNELWGTDCIGTAVKKAKESVACEVRLSVLGNLVNDRFDDAFHSGTVLGYYRRVLFGEYPLDFPSYLYRPPKGSPAFRPELEGDDLNFTPVGRQPVAVEIADDVWDERDRWVKEEGIEPYIIEPVLRVALVCASFDGRSALRAADLGPTLAYLKHQAAARLWLKPNVGENLDAILGNKIMDYLRRYAPHGQPLNLRRVLKAVHAYDRFGLPIAERVLTGLTRQRLVVIDSKIAAVPGGKKETIALSEEERQSDA